jgi:hypothetical protein
MKTLGRCEPARCPSNLKKKPAGMNAGRYQLGEALESLSLLNTGSATPTSRKPWMRGPAKYSVAYNDLTDAQIAEAIKGGHDG